MPQPPRRPPTYNQRRILSPRIIIAAAIVIIIIVIFVLRGHPTPPTTTTSLYVAPTTTTTVSSGPTTTAGPTIVLPSQVGFPAYQHIPYDDNGILVTLTGVASDGRFDLEVYSQSLTRVQERTAYERFLAMYHDPGTKYLPTFTVSTTPTPFPPQ